MATPTRPCPYCGASVLQTATHCGNCGRPMPPAPPAEKPAAKTIFGYQAPKIDAAKAPALPPDASPIDDEGADTVISDPPAGAQASTLPGGIGSPAPVPGQAGGGGAKLPPPVSTRPPPKPAAKTMFGTPALARPPGPASGANAPATPSAPAVPPTPAVQPPAPAAQPPAMNPTQPPLGGPAFGQPPGQPPAPNPVGQPPMPGQQPPPQAQGHPGAGAGAMPGQPGAGAGHPGAGAGADAMPGHPGPGAMPGQPGAGAMAGQQPGAMPGQPGAMPGQPGAMPGGFPGGPQAQYPAAQWNKPNTQAVPLGALSEKLLGRITQKLTDHEFLRKALIVSGIAVVVVTLAIPFARFSIPGGDSKMMFAFSEGMPKFRLLVWPLIAAAAYLFSGFAPPNLRQSLPRWLFLGAPLLIAGLSTAIVGWGASAGTGQSDGIEVIVRFSYPILVAGLLLHRTRAGANISKILIGIGGGFILIYTINFMVDVMFRFSHVHWTDIIHNLLYGVVLIVATASTAIAFTAQVPQLRPVARFAAPITALLIVFVPFQLVYLLLAGLIQGMGITAVLVMLHQTVYAIAFAALFVLLIDLGSKQIGELVSSLGGQPQQGQFQQPGFGQPGFPPQGPGMQQQPGGQQPGGMPPQPGGQHPGGMPPQHPGGGMPPQHPGGAMPPQKPGAVPPQKPGAGMQPQHHSGGMPPQGPGGPAPAGYNQPGPAPAGYPGQPGPAPAGYPGQGPEGPQGPGGQGGSGGGGGGWPPGGGGT